jgi:hypothetical protein
MVIFLICEHPHWYLIIAVKPGLIQVEPTIRHAQLPAALLYFYRSHLQNIYAFNHVSCKI